jgi:Arc/MetJ-type ribon-helix-helix transcriptional regulator
MHISIPKQLEEYIEQQIEAGAFTSPDDFICQAVETYRLVEADINKVTNDDNLTPQKQNRLRQAVKQGRMLAIAYNLHEIEGNPLLAEEKAMFDDFDQQGLSNEECREHIRKIAIEASALSAKHA